MKKSNKSKLRLIVAVLIGAVVAGYFYYGDMDTMVRKVKILFGQASVKDQMIDAAQESKKKLF